MNLLFFVGFLGYCYFIYIVLKIFSYLRDCDYSLKLESTYMGRKKKKVEAVEDFEDTIKRLINHTKHGDNILLCVMPKDNDSSIVSIVGDGQPCIDRILEYYINNVYSDLNYDFEKTLKTIRNKFNKSCKNFENDNS